MSGIAFIGPRVLDHVVPFYVEQLGPTVWLDQPDYPVRIDHNLLLGL